MTPDDLARVYDQSYYASRAADPIADPPARHLARHRIALAAVRAAILNERHLRLACIIAGDRHAGSLRWEPVIRQAFARLHPEANTVIVLHGAAQGIDTIAAALVQREWPTVAVLPFPARWDEAEKVHGDRNKAGPIRNSDMLARLLQFQAAGYRVGVMAFHDTLARSRGTGNMVRIANAANVPVLTYTSTESRTGGATAGGVDDAAAGWGVIR